MTIGLLKLPRHYHRLGTRFYMALLSQTLEKVSATEEVTMIGPIGYKSKSL